MAGELVLPAYTEIVDHIDHLIKVAGSDHVGLGSDVGIILATPAGMEDCSKVPLLTEEMLRGDYSDDDALKVLEENVLRVMEAVMGE